MKKSPEFPYSFQVFSFLWNTHRCFSVALGQIVHVMRMCLLLWFHSHAILMTGNLVRIAEDLFVAEDLQG